MCVCVYYSFSYHRAACYNQAVDNGSKIATCNELVDIQILIQLNWQPECANDTGDFHTNCHTGD